MQKVQKEPRMLETLDRLMLAGLGAWNMTKEKAESIFDEYVRRGEVERNSRDSFVRDLVDSAERTRIDLRNFVERQVRQSVDRMNLATKDDIARLEAKIDALMQSKV